MEIQPNETVPCVNVPLFFPCLSEFSVGLQNVALAQTQTAVGQWWKVPIWDGWFKPLLLGHQRFPPHHVAATRQ